MKTLKENNQGFSLIEIIVTILVIALVVSPFLRSFFLAMNINGDARRLQNATVVCQNVIEEFKARTIDDIIEYSDNVYGVEASTEELLIDGKTYTKYVFEDWELTGADGETFYATITMDPTPYTSDGEKTPVNSLTSPEFSSLFGSDAIMLFKQYTDPDNELESYFRAKGELSEAEIATLSPQNVTKATKMLIDCVYDSSTDIYEYEVTLN
ncbi:MAG: type II secretion system GspH family protein, partial [Lachnospiraceae bacterium]|nr:type II secretion system GspH family protein [Lachnospiraceae bacterium]